MRRKRDLTSHLEADITIAEHLYISRRRIPRTSIVATMRSLAALPLPLLALITTTLSPAIAADASTSGLVTDNLNHVTCSRPSKSGDRIAVHYRGSLQSTGVEFDESYRRGAPFTFTLGAGQVIEGWDLGLQDMCPSERRNLTIPPELGYGSSGTGPIPGGATLVFETELVDIVGVKQEKIEVVTASAVATAVATATEEGAFGIATAPPEPPKEEESGKDELVATPLEPQEDAPQSPIDDSDSRNGECQLLGPFALLVQGALGVVALLALVWKRYRESPKRPWKIWFFDVSKQVIGSILLHGLNLAMSMVSSPVDVVNAVVESAAKAEEGPGGRKPNPCSFYLLNLGIDVSQTRNDQAVI